MKDPLSLLHNNPNIWRARDQHGACARFALGVDKLDKALQGGIHTSGMIRVSCATGTGELSLFKQVISQHREHKLRVFINPPAELQAPWLVTQSIAIEQVLVISPTSEGDALWAAEQCLKSAACHCVLLWSNAISPKEARRLQVAASHNDALCFLFSHLNKNMTSLPVVLDIKLAVKESNMVVDILKHRQGWPINNLVIPFTWTPSNHAIQWAMLNNKRNPRPLHSVS